MSRTLGVFTLLLVCASGASAQLADSPSLRIQQTSATSRLAGPAPSPLSPRNLARLQFSDSTRQPTYWQTGSWLGAGIGASFGTLVAATMPYEGKVTTGKRLSDGLIAAVLVGGPLAVIGGLIGDSIKR